MFKYKQQLTAAFGLLAVATASALPTPAQIYTAEDEFPAGTVTADVLAARTTFRSKLDNSVGSFGFEQPGVFVGDASPLAVEFAGSASSTITATLNGSPGQQVMGSSESGRFNTTAGGSQYWRVDSSSNGSFSISFSRAISAFGFYGTDIGDFGGMLKLVLTPSAGGVDEELVVRSGAAQNGALLFYGFADANSAYSKITFVSTGTGTASDYFGFDDFVVADAGQVLGATSPPGVPEPGTLALAGLALFAAGWARKSQRRA